MDHTEIIRRVEDSVGTSKNDLCQCFTDEIIRRWLDENQWIFDSSLPCRKCDHLKDVFHTDAEQCREKIVQGASCYRRVLKELFAPFLKNALQGTYPPVSAFSEVIYWHEASGQKRGSTTLADYIMHELGGVFLRIKHGLE